VSANMTESSARGGRKANENRPPMGGLGFLNPERVAPLVPKYANKIGKTLSKVSIHYSEDGVEVEVETRLDGSGAVSTESECVTLAEFHRRVGEANTPTDSERLRQLRRKYELRLNREFPTPGPASGSEPDIQAFIDALPFQERRAILMTQKAFEKAHPEGFRA
jgi:hypothetical protein